MARQDDDPRDAPPALAARAGLDLRDYFAGCALTGLLAAGKVSQEAAAASAWRYADDMLRKRSEDRLEQLPLLTSFADGIEDEAPG